MRLLIVCNLNCRKVVSKEFISFSYFCGGLKNSKTIEICNRVKFYKNAEKTKKTYDQRSVNI